MKKQLLALFCLFIFAGSSVSQVPNLAWGHTIATQNLLSGFYWTQLKAPVGSGTDAAGNVYMGGHISGETFDFDPTAGAMNLSSVNDSLDIFITKYDANGALSWAFTIASVKNDNLSDLKTDAAGNVYIMGAISAPADFDPSASSAQLNPVGKAGFVAKYNSSGAYQWAFLIPNTVSANPLTEFHYMPIVNSLCLHPNGNVYITGVVANGIFDFDPGTGVSAVDAVTSTSLQTYIAAYTSGGSFLWVTAFGSAIAHRELSVDASGQLVLSGAFTSLGEFNPNGSSVILSSGGSAVGDGFIAKYNSGNCVLQWIKQISASDGGIYKHCVSQNGDINVFGLFKGSIDLDPGTGTYLLTEPNFGSYMVASYDSAGNFNWGFKYDTTLFVEDILFEPQSGDLLTCGYIFHATDFDPSSGTAVVDTMEDVNGYIHQGYMARYSSAGAYKNAAINNTFNFNMAAGSNGEIFCLGLLQGIADIDLTSNTSLLSSFSPLMGFYSSDYSIYKYSALPLSVKEGESAQSVTVFPLPAQEEITIQAPFSIGNYKLSGIDGCALKEGFCAEKTLQVSLKGLSAGIYILSLNQGAAVKQILVTR